MSGSILLVGVDYRRTAGIICTGWRSDPGGWIDFTKPQINLVAIPRNLLVTPPSRLEVGETLAFEPGLFLRDRGHGLFRGSGYGAGSLAETMRRAWDHPERYLVVNFQAFEDSSSTAIGGVGGGAYPRRWMICRTATSRRGADPEWDASVGPGPHPQESIRISSASTIRPSC